MAPIDAIEGIGPAYAARLRKSGIRTCEKLLTLAASAPGRKALADPTGFSTKSILEWVNRADLMRVRGVGSEYSDLLEAAGVDTVKELRNRNAANLTAKVAEVNDAKVATSGQSIVRRLPTLSMVERWVDHAKQLDPVVTY